MPMLAAMRALLITIGLMSIACGLLWPRFKRVGIGHLPGDFQFDQPGFSRYIPLGSGLLISVVLSLVLTAVSRYLRQR